MWEVTDMVGTGKAGIPGLLRVERTRIKVDAQIAWAASRTVSHAPELINIK